MAKTIDQLLSEVRSRLVRLEPRAAAEAVADGGLLIDIRPSEQRRREGEVPGALLIERNVLEWRLDPASAHRIPQVSGYDQAILIICSEGYASSLAAGVLQELGLHRATDVTGGFRAWAEAGLPVITPSPVSNSANAGG
jgi:rhodanese-related sulfurtransferase